MRASVSVANPDKQGAPLRQAHLLVVDDDAEIAALLEKREPLYRETATLIVETTGRDVGEIVDEIAREVQRK